MIFLTLFLEFLKIGLFTIGGGYAMIPLVKETVMAHGWLSEGEFLNMIGLSEVTPGPIAINMATYVGSLQGGLALGTFGSFLGGLLATIAVILPSFVVILLISMFFAKWGQNRYIKGFFKGVSPIVVALIFTTALILLSDVLFPVNVVNSSVSIKFNKTPIFIFLLIVFIYFTTKFVAKKKIPAIALIAIGAVLGIVVNYLV